MIAMRLKRLLLPLAVAAALAAFAAPYDGVRPECPPGTLRITQISAGTWGDCYLIFAPDDSVTLLDTSHKPHEVLLPVLRRFGISRLRQVIISHPHSDHFDSLPALLKDRSIAVGRVLWSPIGPELIRAMARREKNPKPGLETADHNEKIIAEFTAAANHRRIPIIEVRTGDIIEFGGGAKAEVLISVRSEVEQPFNFINNNSMVFRLTYGEFSILFTGDMGFEQEKALLETGRPLRSDALKVPHHGGGQNSGIDFIRAVDPQIAVVSTFPYLLEKWGKPVRDRYESLKIPYYPSCEYPDLTIVSNGRRFHLCLPETKKEIKQ